jgi:hypothetical protein
MVKNLDGLSNKDIENAIEKTEYLINFWRYKVKNPNKEIQTTLTILDHIYDKLTKERDRRKQL